ncbi:unnamed protein product, partial [Didymodactylos carnosus]
KGYSVMEASSGG